MKITNAINNIPAIQSGGSVTFNLPVGIRYHGFNLFLSSAGVRTAITATNLVRVRVTIDTVTLIDWDWTSIYLYATSRSIPLSIGQIPIFFTDPLLVGLRNAYAGSIDTKQGITNVQVYILIGAVTTPTLTGELIFDFLQNTKPVWNAGVKTVVASNTPLMKTAQVENIPLVNGYQISDISNNYPLDTLILYNGADAFITYLRLALNGLVIFEGAPQDIARDFITYGIINPVGSIVLPFTYDRFSPNSAAAFTTIAITVNSNTAFAMGVAVVTQLPSIT
jgi:Viral coat protein P2 N-terminal domain